MIDTHCHIDFEDYDKDRNEVIQRAKDNLDAVINSGTSLKGNETVLNLSKKHEGFLYPSFGFHPVTSQDCTNLELKEAQKHLINHIDDIVAIGEVGMDYFYCKDKTLRERQKEIFTSFIEIANDYKVPLLMHVRDCERKAFNMIKDSYDDIPVRVFHCFSGSLKTARRIMDLDGYYMSFSTMVCYSERHQELVKEIPLDYILTETDSPYLAMTKEERNEPANVVKAVKKIAEIKNMDVDTVGEVTTKNAMNAFNLK